MCLRITTLAPGPILTWGRPPHSPASPFSMAISSPLEIAAAERGTNCLNATEAAEPGKHALVNDLIADFSTLSSELQASRDAELAELHAAQATRTVQRSLFS